MRPELDAALVRDFPRLYRDRHGDPIETSMCYGFPGDGWEPLIRRLSEKLEPIARETDLHTVQVKEKFGGLRFYVNGSRKLLSEVSETLYAAIHVAEEEAFRTCEHCGAPGSTENVSKSWLATLCTACHEREVAHRAASRP